jgi:hypothetical protein
MVWYVRIWYEIWYDMIWYDMIYDTIQYTTYNGDLTFIFLLFAKHTFLKLVLLHSQGTTLLGAVNTPQYRGAVNTPQYRTWDRHHLCLSGSISASYQSVPIHSCLKNRVARGSEARSHVASICLHYNLHTDHPCWCNTYNVHRYFQSQTAHSWRSSYRLATSFDLVYRSSSGRLYKNMNINRK